MTTISTNQSSEIVRLQVADGKSVLLVELTKAQYADLLSGRNASQCKVVRNTFAS